MNFSNDYGADPNYVGSSLQPTQFYQDVKGVKASALSTFTEHEKWTGEVCTFQSHVTDEDFVQPAALWDVIGREAGHQQRFFGNVAIHLCQVKHPSLRQAVYGGCYGDINGWRVLYMNCRLTCARSLLACQSGFGSWCQERNRGFGISLNQSDISLLC
jgi:hypothetical protein